MTKLENKINIDVAEMERAGVNLGHRTSKLHPQMARFTAGIRNTVNVIDLEKTKQQLEAALAFIDETIRKGETILFVSTKIPLKNLVQAIAKDCEMPFVVERWLGGTFTNFGVIAKRVQHFKTLRKDKEENRLDKYTKKERIKIEKEYNDLKTKFEGIENMDKLPEAVLICDIVKDDLCLKEAKMKNVKTIAIVDTNANPLLPDFPICANDDAISAVRYILEKVKEVILVAKVKDRPEVK